jgi:glycogen debranching enzyme
MFAIPHVRGIVVGNAQPELRQAVDGRPVYLAGSDEICAQAILQGFVHFGLFNPQLFGGPPDAPDTGLLESIQRSEHEVVIALGDKDLATIREGYLQAIVALRKNLTPLGFSACSLEDNETSGTDENYRSVWARDGAITILGSLRLMRQDDEVRTCQRQTLETILSHITPSGQLPANVGIDDETPAYSGVGGIAAVDSALWIIIAFYEFIRATQDIDLLRTHVDSLQRAMTWLSAQDSNNDGLLEIPEAGDWTDLFGRSYNVLYDEVLWYQTNLCFGRMLELLGNDRQAGDYFRWARIIKREILAHFWPTTKERTYRSVSFAEQQYEIGDARYLIAQVTPFGYSWRCDTYGNVLAYLYGVIDQGRASQAFRFMWGVGVNEPYPIANLYPVVTAGEPDWRQYYTVNLLNLPNHYHNGGIWPFVGGAWVRFINKLGLRDIALKELHKLAQLNKLGVLNEWEFNEWAHGKTGRPMGKAYQAWSASEYILACHALNVVA